MKRTLDLADIQGNIVRAYGRYGFPITRHLFFHIGNPAAGRKFIDLVRGGITTAERWTGVDGDQDPAVVPRPVVAINLGLTFRGMAALALPTKTLSGMPEEFIDGMARRSSMLGDFGVNAPDHWDPIWRESSQAPDKQVHIWISLNASAKPDGTPVDALAERTDWLRDIAAQSGGVTLLSGHRGPSDDYQDSQAIMASLPDGRRVATAKEHFGFTDGIGDPTFAGQYEPEAEALAVIGGGKILPKNEGWAPLATGEFILGHASEAQELPPSAAPWSFMRNGTFMAYRKLHQNIARFQDYVTQQAERFPRDASVPTQEAAHQTILAKMVGRWPSGIPLAAAPTYDDAVRLEQQWADIPALNLKPRASLTPAEQARLVAYARLLTDFRYRDDPEGAKCPVASHMRRVNPRDGLDPLMGQKDAALDSALTNRRRILRRGLPYGDGVADYNSEHGVVFTAFCTSLFRQFEFIQQQWVAYGGSFNVGNDTDPLVGPHGDRAKFVIPADPKGSSAPFICAHMPQFVETRGGDYFFIPSLTALREIAAGSVDPT